MQYFARLDGIRGLAVAGVLLSHSFWWHPVISKLPLGGIGVRVFFVLSGFLITRILLDYRERFSVPEAARKFYWRRLLRLGPAFALAVSISALFGIANMRNDWPIHVLYLSNFLVAFRGTWNPVGHLWSLAVEEQFYLVWFAVVVWLPRRYLLPSIAGGLLLAPIFRLSVAGMPGLPSVLTPSVIDSLTMGALIGWASREQPRLFATFQSRGLLYGSILAVVALSLIGTSAKIAFFAVAINLMSAALIALAVGKPGLEWLRFGPLQALGKISYGVYLYHAFMPPLLAYFGVIVPRNLLGAMILILISLVAAAVSWVLIERPALSLKDGRTLASPVALNTPSG